MRTLVVLGSPKGLTGASYALGSALANELEKRGVEVAYAVAAKALRSEPATEALIAEIVSADLVVLSFPLYVDSLPAPLTRVLELAAEGAMSAERSSARRLAVLTQCGFPEVHQCDTAVAICRLFAREAGMKWAGVLAIGEGGMLGNGIDKLPGGGKALRAVLAQAADGLASGGAIPDAAAEAARRPFIPAWAYAAIANLSWHLSLRGSKAKRPMAYRPYAQG